MVKYHLQGVVRHKYVLRRHFYYSFHPTSFNVMLQFTINITLSNNPTLHMRKLHIVAVALNSGMACRRHV